MTIKISKQICITAKYDNSFCYEINFTPNPTKRKEQKKSLLLYI